MLKVLVLGSAAGGGSPQWNCNGPVSRAVRNGEVGTSPRTQSSIAVTADNRTWFLFNASPDLGAQILANHQLHPADDQLRHSPIDGVVLTNGDVDHVAGLLTLRERHPLAVYAHPRVLDVIGGNSIFNVLNPDVVDRRPLVMNQPLELLRKNGDSSGLMIEAFDVPGKVALWLEDESAKDNFGTQAGDTIGLKISSRDKHFFYIPGCAAMTANLGDRLRHAPMVFFDGTLWQDDEMAQSQVGEKTGQRMGHMSNSGPEGSIAAFTPLDVERKIFIHINTTNPILLPESPEYATATAAGWEVAYDGMEIAL